MNKLNFDKIQEDYDALRKQEALVNEAKASLERKLRDFLIAMRICGEARVALCEMHRQSTARGLVQEPDDPRGPCGFISLDYQEVRKLNSLGYLSSKFEQFTSLERVAEDFWLGRRDTIRHDDGESG